MASCRMCPRECGVDRDGGRTGFCGVPSEVYLARAALHFWEEPCISGTRGSGTVFFSGCVLRCVYCQNYEIAHAGAGSPVTIPRLAGIFQELQEKGAHNINLVTPTHYVPQIREAALLAREKGLTIPFVFNCGGYEKPETLRLMDGIVDVYLTDFKYMDAAAAAKYSGAADYPEKAKEALAEMVRQCPGPIFDEDGIMTKGVIVRHLLLPGMVKNGKAVTEYLWNTCGDRIWISLMNQYTPFERVKLQYPEIGRKVTGREYRHLVEHALNLGFTNAFIQEGKTAKESFIPSFDGEGVISGKEEKDE